MDIIGFFEKQDEKQVFFLEWPYNTILSFSRPGHGPVIFFYFVIDIRGISFLKFYTFEEGWGMINFVSKLFFLEVECLDSRVDS